MSSFAGTSLLYNRVLHLEITPPKSQTTLYYGNLKPQDAALRVAFAIERTLDGQADKAKISVTNMKSANRDAVAPGSYVLLQAGYQTKNGLLFTGFVDKVKSTPQGPDIVLEAECSDGALELTFAVVKRSYAEQVTLARVLQDLASDLNVTIDGQVISVTPGVIMGIPNVVFDRGLTLDGPIATSLDYLLRPRNIDWCVQNGKLVIAPKDSPIGAQPCAVLSGSTGMIDTPAFNEKGLVVSSLLNSDILPGRLLQIDSKNKKVSGFFKAMTCKYEGDTHDQSWRVEVECEAVEGEVTTMPLATPTDFTRAVV